MAVLCIFLVVACYFDYRKGRIPNLLLVCILLYGLGYAMAEGGYSGILTYVGLSVPVILIFYPFFKIGCLYVRASFRLARFYYFCFSHC